MRLDYKLIIEYIEDAKVIIILFLFKNQIIFKNIIKLILLSIRVTCIRAIYKTQLQQLL